MNAVKMPVDTQAKVQAAGSKTASEKSSGDDFMKLLQVQQNTSQPQKTEDGQTEKGITQNLLQQNSAKNQEEGVEESKEDITVDDTKGDTSKEDILQQALLQQAAAQMAGVVTQMPVQTQETVVQAAETENIVPAETILTDQGSKSEPVIEQAEPVAEQHVELPIPQVSQVSQQEPALTEKIYQQEKNPVQETELQEKPQTYQDSTSQAAASSQPEEAVAQQPEQQPQQVQENLESQVQPKAEVPANPVEESQAEPKAEVPANPVEEFQAEPKAEVPVNPVEESQAEPKAEVPINLVEDQIEDKAPTAAEPQEFQKEAVAQESKTQKVQEPKTQNVSKQQVKEQEQTEDQVQAKPEMKTEKSQESSAQEEKGSGMNQEPGNQGILYHSISQQGEVQQVPTGQETERIFLHTTESELPQDLGKELAVKLPGIKQTGPSTLTVELEPASLGKLTIKLIYEAGRAEISILSSNPRTLEILNQRAGEIASILKEKTGQETVIYTQPSQQQENPEEEQQQGGRRNQQEQEERHQSQKESQHQTESFAQQLRLGLI